MNTTDIRQKMEEWARWRHFRYGGYGKSILQRLREGMPGTNCPTCGSAGRVPGATFGHKATWLVCPTCGGSGKAKLEESAPRIHAVACPNCIVERHGRRYSSGEVNGRTCFRCRGLGVVIRDETKVNPAFIPSTYREPDNPTCQRIDRLVCELRQRDALLGYWFVIHAEYCDARGGTQEIKAERLGLGAANYRKRLQRALEWVESGLADGRDCRVIQFTA
jgi:hypothetical protein